MQDALPYTTLPIYPGLGQAPNTLACIPGGQFIHNVNGDKSKTAKIIKGNITQHHINI